MTAPAASAYRRWRRLLTEGRASARDTGITDTAYAVYVAVALAAMYGSMAWSAASSLGLGRAGAWDLRRVALLAAGVLLSGAWWATRAGVPLWVSGLERVHVLAGQFPAGVVLRRRAVITLASAAVTCALGFAAAASGGGSATSTALWAVWGGSVGVLAVGVGAAAQVSRLRVSSAVVALALLGTGAGAAARGASAATAAGPGAVWLVAGLVAAVAALWLVLVLVPDRIDVDDVARRGSLVVSAGAGVAAGDTLSATRLAQLRPRGPRRLLRDRVGGPVVTVVRRDLVGLRRRVVAVLLATVAGAGGVWLVHHGLTSASARTALVVTGALLVHAATLGWCAGLGGFLRQPRPGGLLPCSPGAGLLAHLVVPVALTGVAVLAGAALASATASLDGAASATTTAVALLALAARTWTLSSTLVPVTLNTPVSTPMGDMSVVVVLSYYLRGWLLVGAVAWLVASAGTSEGWVVPTVAVLVCLLTTHARVQRG